MATVLTDRQIHETLADLPGWRYEGGKLSKTFQFDSFEEAVSFVVRVAMHSHAERHHPEIYNNHSTVQIWLNTHAAGDKVTDRDAALARIIERFNWLPDAP
jgi:4a-hydroxytetrahydrobiopterin dehydratase